MILVNKMYSKYLSIIVVLLLNASTAFADIDYLDTTFGPNTTGIVTSTINSGSVVNGSVVDSSGNIVIIGNTIINSITNILVARYTSAGVLDNSFGSDGTVTFISGPQSTANAVAIDSSNNIVVAGNDGSNNVLLLRYTTAGTLDTSFGTGGVATLTIGDASATSSMVIDANGNIVVAGSTSFSGVTGLFIARFTSAGVIDTSFGNASSGYNTVTAGSFYSGNSLAIDLNAKLVVAGAASTNDGSDFLIVRFDTNGQLDTTFNTTGVVTTNIIGNNLSIAQSVLVNSSNHIVASGYTMDNNSGTNSDVIVRYNNDGSLDTSFGVNSDGIVVNSIGTNSQVFASLLDSNENIYIGGVSDNNFVTARYTTNGSLDTTFGQAGIVVTPINNFSQINALALQADDRVVAGGFATGSGFPPVQQVALVRYNKNNTDFINITSIANNSVITTKVPIFSGTSSAANAQVQIIIDNVLFTTIPTDSSGNWTVQTNALTIGVHSILVKLVVSSIVVVSEKINFTTIETMGEDTLFAYSNVSQTTTTANTFQTITFNNLLGNDNNIWTNVGNNTLQYKAPETGKFFITYSAEAGILNAASATSINIAIRLLKNGTELPSQTNTQLNVPINGNGIQLLTNSGIVTLAQNDTIQLQYAKSTALAAGIIANQGSGTIRPSISVNILRLQ